MAQTDNFRSVQPLGVAMPPEDKNASLLPRRVGGRFVMFHRPSSALSGHADIWLSYSADLKSWTRHVPVLRARHGAWWDSARIGMGPPPLETRHGWLCTDELRLYYGAADTVVAVATATLSDVLQSLDLAHPG